MKKNNLKSVRISDEVMSYILNFEGEGFNQKFENLVLFCMSQESAKRTLLSTLDREITLQYAKLSAARQLQVQLTRTSYLMNDVEVQLQNLVRLMYELQIPSDACISKTALQPGEPGGN